MDISRFHDMGLWLVGNINGLKPLLFTVIVNYRKHGAAASPCAARRSTRRPGRARRRGRRRRWRACSECPLLWCAETDGASHQPAAETTSFKLRHTSAAARARLLRSQPVMPNGKKETPFDFKRNQFMVIYPFLETSTTIENTFTGVQHCQL